MQTKILLADDSIGIQRIISQALAAESIEVITFSNGDAAEQKLADVRPDLVLADVFMPGKDGYELCRAIKQNPEFRSVPVLLLVDTFEPFDQSRADGAGADGCLKKPVNSGELIETVRRFLPSAGGAAQASPAAPAPSPPAPSSAERPSEWSRGPGAPITGDLISGYSLPQSGSGSRVPQSGSGSSTGTQPEPGHPPSYAGAGSSWRSSQSGFKQCRNHPDSAAAGRCAGCAEAFCSNCLVEIHGQRYCGNCKALALQGRPAS